MSWRALIVDDNASMRAMLTALLESQGYTVVAALEDGSEVMSVVHAQKPDIVCLDYQMPGRDGLSILREINETVPEVDVLFMTAAEDPDLEHQVADAGAAGFLRKPFGQSQVLQEIEQVRLTRERANAAPKVTATVYPKAPLAPSESPKKPLSSPSTVQGVRANSVVVADDNGSIRLLLKGLLTGMGLDVVRLATNGQEAINAVRDNRPALLCLDVDMPVMGGLEALPLIRQVSPQTVVVMVTGQASRAFVEKAAALGARGYILKPVRPAYIENFVRKLLT